MKLIVLATSLCFAVGVLDIASIKHFMELEMQAQRLQELADELEERLKQEPSIKLLRSHEQTACDIKHP